MIEVMNFFQAIFMFKNITPIVNLKTAEINLAVALKSEALELAAVAEQETQNGATTQALSFEETDRHKRRAFAEIAVWHHARAQEKYNKAADRFDEAGRVYKKKIRAFQVKAQEMRQRAAKAAVAVNALSEFLIQK